MVSVRRLRATGGAPPELPAAVSAVLGAAADGARVVAAQERPTCSLYRVQVHDGEDVMVKARHPHPPGRAGAASGRPDMNPLGVMSPQEGARLEHEGLSLIDDVLGQEGPYRFLRIRPLYLAETDGVLAMAFLPLPTLKQALRTTARWSPTGGAGDLTTLLRRAGQWLRLYHAAGDARWPALPSADVQSAAAVVDLLSTFAGYLRRYDLPARQARQLRDVGAALEPALPATFRCAVRHGDFSPRNVLVAPRDRVGVLDPMPRWRVPVHHDVATFLYGTRMQAIQVASHGLAYSRDTIDRFEQAFLSGYGGSPPVELAAFKLLVLLDHWAGVAAAAADATRTARPVRALRAAWSHRYHVGELDRQLDELRDRV